MGALVMSHSDDNGLVLPPKLAPIQVVIIPIYQKTEQLEMIRSEVTKITDNLKAKGISFKFDDRDTQRPGFKFAEYELKGVPVRLALGPRDIEQGTIEVVRRDTLEKSVVQQAGIAEYIENLLEDIQQNIFQKAKIFRDQNIRKADSYDEFKNILEEKGGFILAHWDGTPETEERIKTETKATIRSLPFEYEKESGVCIVTGKPAERRVLFAKSY
jgi:prolyl-tRNA synthetase